MEVIPEAVGEDSCSSDSEDTTSSRFVMLDIFPQQNKLKSCYSLNLILNRAKLCFFTSESTMKKDRFMQLLNHSYGEGGLTCGFNDYQLSEFIQQKRRKAGKLPKGKAVVKVGPQDDGSWVLGPNIYISSAGEEISPDDSNFFWVGHMYNGPGIAPQNTACSIQYPLMLEPLCNLIEYLMNTMGHNFFPTLMVMGSCAMALHYKTILSKFLFCPVPLAFGNSGAGKTTALRCGLAITGCHPERFYSKATVEKYIELSADSYMPFAIDDPKSKAAINDLTISLFNGAKGATIKRGERIPSCMPVISANFTTSEQMK